MKNHEENRTKRPLKIDVKSCKTQTETVRKSGHRADIPRASRCFLLFQEKRRKGSCSSRCSQWPRSRSLSYFYPCRHIHYTYIYNYYSLSTYICITTTLIDDMLLSRSSNVYVHIMYRSSIVRPLYTRISRCRDAGAHAYYETGSTLFYILSFTYLILLLFFFFLFNFLFLKIAAHCCDVVCLQGRELLLRCQWLHSSLAPCHFMLQSPSPPPPPLFHPFAYDTSRRAVMPSRATPPERENERFPREKRVVVKSKRFPLLYTVGGWAHGCPV